MNDLTVVDLLLMLLAQPRSRREHASNLDLFKTLFERDIGGINLIFNLVTGIGVAILIAIIGFLVEGIGGDTSDTALWAMIGITIAVLAIPIIIVWRLFRIRRQIKQRFLYLIRLYYYLDGVT